MESSGPDAEVETLGSNLAWLSAGGTGSGTSNFGVFVEITRPSIYVIAVLLQLELVQLSTTAEIKYMFFCSHDMG